MVGPVVGLVVGLLVVLVEGAAAPAAGATTGARGRIPGERSIGVDVDHGAGDDVDPDDIAAGATVPGGKVAGRCWASAGPCASRHQVAVAAAVAARLLRRTIERLQ